MFKIIFFLISTTLLFLNCNHRTKQENGLKASFSSEEDSYIDKSHEIILDSVVLIHDTLRIEFRIRNYLCNKVYFPIIEKFPNFSLEDRENILDNNTSGLFIQWFKGDKEIYPPESIPIPLGHIPPLENPTWEDSIWFENIYKPYWERKNLIETERLRRTNRPYKETFNWYFRRYFLIEKENILSPKEVKKFVIKFGVSDQTNRFNNNCSYNLEFLMTRIDSIKLKIVSNSIFLKDSILLLSDLDDFKNSETLIFHGTLESNKVPIVFEKE